MSPLTKIFVGMLIICSLLMTAAFVVFVNRADDYSVVITRERAEKARLTSEKTDIESKAVQDGAAAKSQIDQLNRLVTQLQGDVAKANAARDAAVAQAAKLETEKGVLQAENLTLAKTLNVKEESLAAERKRNDGLLVRSDKLQTENFSLAGMNTDLEKRLAEAERELRFRTEQLAQSRAERDNYLRVIQDNRLSVDAARPAPALQDVKGHIRSIKPVDGHIYATITVGSAEKVEKGMQFKVINQHTMEFLGTLTVDAVEPNEAFGRLEGPRVAEIRKDHQVRSQL